MRPQVFVGSSVESLPIVYAVQENLDHDADVTVWSQGIFDLSKATIESLEKALNQADFGIFVLGPEDRVQLRGNTYLQARDNVVFELGLFIGKLGRERTYWLVPRNVPEFHVPTDLIGVTPAEYDPARSSNWKAAVGVACNRIRESIHALGIRIPDRQNAPAYSFILHEEGRIPLRDTVELMETAKSDIVVMGSTLRSWIGYFERTPSSMFKHPVHKLLEKGINFRFYFLDPDSNSAVVYSEDRRDEAIEEIRESINDLRDLAAEFCDLPGSLEVFVYACFPFGYVLLIDPDSTNGKAFVSPYLPGLSRADCPYIDIHKNRSPVLFEKYHASVQALVKSSHCRRLFGNGNSKS